MRGAGDRQVTGVWVAVGDTQPQHAPGTRSCGTDTRQGQAAVPGL